jgi:hypothetical protein
MRLLIIDLPNFDGRGVALYIQAIAKAALFLIN